MLFQEPEEALDYVYNLVNDNKVALGLKFVGYGDETLLPNYPSAVVTFNTPVDRALGPMGQFELVFLIEVLVYHARLTASHKTRTREDMQLATSVRNKLHEDYKAGGGVIFGYVQSERPGVMATGKGVATIGTRLLWIGTSRALF